MMGLRCRCVGWEVGARERLILGLVGGWGGKREGEGEWLI